MDNISSESIAEILDQTYIATDPTLTSNMLVQEMDNNDSIQDVVSWEQERIAKEDHLSPRKQPATNTSIPTRVQPKRGTTSKNSSFHEPK